MKIIKQAELASHLKFFKNVRVKSEDSTIADITQAGFDWWRDRQDLYINGVSLEKIMIEKFGENLKEHEEKFSKNNYQALIEIWEDKLGAKYVDILSKRAHQGNFLNALQTAIFSEAAKNELFLDGRGVSNEVHFVSNKEHIDVIENISINFIRSMTEKDNEGSPKIIIDSLSDKQSVIKAMCVTTVKPDSVKVGAYDAVFNEANLSAPVGDSVIAKILNFLKGVIDSVANLAAYFNKPIAQTKKIEGYKIPTPKAMAVKKAPTVEELPLVKELSGNLSRAHKYLEAGKGKLCLFELKEFREKIYTAGFPYFEALEKQWDETLKQVKGSDCRPGLVLLKAMKENAKTNWVISDMASEIQKEIDKTGEEVKTIGELMNFLKK